MKPKKNYNVDLKKRSTLFLQIGLILVLLFTYLVVEWKTYSAEVVYKEYIPTEEVEETVIPITVMSTPTPPKLPEIPTKIDLIPEDEPEPIEDPIEPEETEPTDFVEPRDITEAKKEDPIEEVPFEFIENVPIFPGCEGMTTNEDRKRCMSEKITQFVNKKFNKDIGNQAGLTGINRVNVLFKIDKEGNIIEVQTRAPHPKLEEEAARVINALPSMQPGIQRGKPVIVSYALPIIFQVQ